MKTLLLIDANALIHRAYHALPKFTAKDGRPTGALYGVASILIKFFKEAPVDYVVAAFDRPEPTFRESLSVDYKAHRPEPDKDLVLQIKEAYNLFKSFGIRVIDVVSFEADDIIASLVVRFKYKKDLKIVILTGDMDALQLVSGERVVVQALKKGVSETMIYDEKAVFERYGLKPEQIPDYKGLIGDVSDNIPGVKGIGPKTALQILQKYETIENLYDKISSVDPLLLKEKLIENKDQVMLSRKLATMRHDVGMELENLEELKHGQDFIKFASEYLMQFGFKSLIARMIGEKIEKKEKVKAKQGSLL